MLGDSGWLVVLKNEMLRAGEMAQPLKARLTTKNIKNGGSFGVEVFLVLGGFCLLFFGFFFHFLNLFIESLRSQA